MAVEIGGVIVQAHGGGRTAKRLAAAVVLLLVVCVLLAALFVGGRLWWVGLRGPEGLTPARAGTGSVALAWDPSPDASVTGYKILFGTEPGKYSRWQTVGNQTTATLSDLEKGTRYYVVAVAFDAQGNQSDPSNEIEVVPK
jgi:hypothetical protein